MNYFVSELKRALISYKTLIAIIITFISLLIGGFEYLFNDSFDIGAIYLYKYAFSDGTISILVFAAPIIACLPFATSYATERESGFLSYIYVKTTPRKYILTKYILTAFLGGFVLFVGTFLFFIFTLSLKGLNPNDVITLNRSLEKVYLFNPLLYIFIEMTFTFIFGMVASTTCLVISDFFKNKYFAIVCTFFLYMLIGITTSTIIPYLNIQIVYDISLYNYIGIPYILLYALLILLLNLFIILKKVNLKEKIIG